MGKKKSNSVDTQPTESTKKQSRRHTVENIKTDNSMPDVETKNCPRDA